MAQRAAKTHAHKHCERQSAENMEDAARQRQGNVEVKNLSRNSRSDGRTVGYVMTLPTIKIKHILPTGDFDEDRYVLASISEAALAEKDAEIESLKLLLSDCLDYFEDTPNIPIAIAIKNILKTKGSHNNETHTSI